MRAARFHTYGDPQVLSVEEVPEPHAGPGSIRIAVEAASVNPIDYLLRAGHLQSILDIEPPLTPGRDASGVVDEIGEGVDGVAIGDVVFGLGGLADTTAEFAVLTAWSAVPPSWSTAQAAAAGLATATAAVALDNLGDLNGRTLLIEGASGGVGTAAAALAIAAGATVIGTGGESNQEYLREQGMLATTYGPGIADRVAALAPGGVDAAFHAAPSASLPDLVSIVGDPSRVVTVADNAGAARLGTLAVNARNESDLLERGAELGRRGRYTPRVDRELALEEIATAHQAAEAGGKTVVTIR